MFNCTFGKSYFFHNFYSSLILHTSAFYPTCQVTDISSPPTLCKELHRIKDIESVTYLEKFINWDTKTKMHKS